MYEAGNGNANANEAANEHGAGNGVETVSETGAGRRGRGSGPKIGAEHEERARGRRAAPASTVGCALAGAALLALTLLSSSAAHAAGTFFLDRGVRPLGRGGALVAGADDLNAISYNPAGLVDAGAQLLLDASWLHQTTSFQRQVQVTGNDPNTGQPVGSSFVQTYPRVSSTTPLLPIPMLAGSYAIRPDLVVALGAYAPYGALPSYPERLSSGAPAPQRYSLLDLDGSSLATVGAWIAWRPIPQLRIGLGPTLLLGAIQTDVVQGSCVPDRFLCAAEQPDYDAKARFRVDRLTALGASFGVIVTPVDTVRLGASWQLGYTVDAPGKLRTQLPTAAVFDQASVEGDSARIHFRLPAIGRLGVEVRPRPTTRIELAFVYERWSVHDRITLTPDDIALRNVALFPATYRVGPVSVDRHFQDAWSLRLGGEHTLRVADRRLDLRAGVAHETSAVPEAYVSVLTPDSSKWIGSIGAGLHLGRVRLDGVFALLLPAAVSVSPTEARLTKVNPVRSNAPTSEVTINGGQYTSSGFVLGLGARYQFGATVL